MKLAGTLLFICLFFISWPLRSASLPDTIELVKPSIVGIATYNKLATPKSRLMGTGFAVKNGNYIATNAHVIPDEMSGKTKLVVLSGNGRRPRIQDAQVIAIDETYDLALLKVSGKALNPLKLSAKKVREGELIAFSGFPLGAILGLHPVTHQGIVSSITPVVIPVRSSKELTVKQLKQLRNPYMVYQLDATAYPGNSGSPVYMQDTGEVIAIINKVLVKKTKEAALSDPTSITYAIPIKYLQALINKN